jgi:hypothetical protein
VIDSWANYIEAIDQLATSALCQLGHESIDLGDLETVDNLGPCPEQLQERAHRAAFQLHEVITAYEQRQSMLLTELHRRPKSVRSLPDAIRFDLSA